MGTRLLKVSMKKKKRKVSMKQYLVRVLLLEREFKKIKEFMGCKNRSQSKNKKIRSRKKIKIKKDKEI